MSVRTVLGIPLSHDRRLSFLSHPTKKITNNKQKKGTISPIQFSLTPKKKEKKTTSSDTSPPEKKSSKKKEEITNEIVNAAKITKDAVPKDDKKTKEKKQPKEKGAPEGGKKSGGKNISSAVAEDAGEPVPSMIDLRVGKIVDSK